MEEMEMGLGEWRRKVVVDDEALFGSVVMHLISERG